MQTFEEYLKEHNLEALTVAVKARIRYMTAYNATKGFPITPEHARLLRQTVFSMSGVSFAGNFILTEPEPTDELPTLPIKRISKQNLM